MTQLRAVAAVIVAVAAAAAASVAAVAMAMTTALRVVVSSCGEGGACFANAHAMLAVAGGVVTTPSGASFRRFASVVYRPLIRRIAADWGRALVSPAGTLLV